MSPRLIALLLVVPSAAFGWGFDGHRRLASNLEEPFANGSCLRAWLAATTGQFSFQDKACDPDRWRSSDASEGPRHYLDIDWANPIESYPREWTEVQAQFGQYAVKNGQVPWRVEELYQQLVEQMRAGNGAAALDTVAYLSHYVTDAFSPMHDTRTQPGPCGGTPECLHLRYESDMLNVSAQIDAITQLARSYYGTVGRADPRNQIFDAVIVGNPVAQQLIADDTSAQQSTSALYTNTKDLTARRWGDALTMMASLIGSAWLEAGSPTLSGMPSGCATAVSQERMVLVGFPLPQPPPDAGTPDAGAQQEDAGTSGGGGTGVGNWQPLPQPVSPKSGGCSCGGGPLGVLVPLFAIAAVLFTRRRQ